MILYHFTDAENLNGIAERGLVPAIRKQAETKVLTLGIPVVWLTSNRAPLWMAGSRSDMCMLTVDVKRKHLHHWRTWLANMESDGIDENGKPHHLIGTKILEAMSLDQEFGAERLTDTSNYWICIGVVRPYHIIQCQHISYVVEGRGTSRIR